MEDRRYDFEPDQRQRVLAALGQALAAESDVAFAFAHGSFLAEHPFHDIDVAVYLALEDRAQIGRRTLALAESLEAALFRELGIRSHPIVDIRALNGAPLGFCYQVLRQGQLLVNRDEPLRTHWTAAAISRYLDIKPLYETALKEAMTTWH